MTRMLPAILALPACAALLSPAALAQGPAFDCAKAKAEAEKLICGDPSLATLDRKLDAVYKAAAAKATGKSASQLRSMQRGWVKGRNECWKANGQQTWMTATWTVDTASGCIEAQYRLRISELQSVWRLVSPKTVFFACQNNPANEVVANFFETDPGTIRLERGDRTVTMWRVGDASAGRYEGRNVGLVHMGNELKVDWLDTNTGKTEALLCKAR
ncbi:MAG: DUF1311 domain-containing protein [Burkholderiales bacterium]|nr:DUF1311 domain-containing protein [Burkholderiales bacterium]